jgi:fumarate hydratase subunit beta
MAVVKLKVPLSREEVEKLSVGDTIFLSGIIYTARDEAHERMLKFLSEGKKLPFSLKDGVIFHCGPLMKKVKDKWVVVCAGPTTSSRLNKVEPEVIEKLGVRGIIGKGGMDDNVALALEKNNAVYLAGTGGAAALTAEKIKSVEGVFWIDLGMPEAVWVLNACDLGPLTVAIAKGKSLYAEVNHQVAANLRNIVQNL